MNKLTNSEAVYAFGAWLTTRPEKAVASAFDDTAAIAELVIHFCQSQGFEDCRENYAEAIVPTPEILTRKPLSDITQEDAEQLLINLFEGKTPSGYKFQGFDKNGVTFFYSDGRKKRYMKQFKYEQFGFEGFNFLQSKGYILA